MATYKEIQAYVKRHYKFTPKTCWIAHALAHFGKTKHKAWNRKSSIRKHPCPTHRWRPVIDSLNQLGMIEFK
ncbi:hypothetical protein [Dongia sp.]|uniref:hypothetical protein n=1 Tax=Dongia sp. TaxID=1977262 RepID=UPI0037502B49